MKVYLVRHGQTDGNVARRHQEETTKLTKLGVQQVHDVAEKIKTLEPTHLLTSNLIRAIQSARIISEKIDLVPETSSHFIELVRPHHVTGHYHRSFKSIFYYLKWYFNGVGGNGDKEGESYAALRERIERAKQQLMEYPDDAKVVVVTHAVFMTFFIAHLCQKKAITPWQGLYRFYQMLTVPNAHVIPIELKRDCEDGTCPWSVE